MESASTSPVRPLERVERCYTSLSAYESLTRVSGVFVLIVLRVALA